MSQEDMQLALEKLRGLRAHVEDYFEREVEMPGIRWTIMPIGHAINHAITEIDTYIQLQQIHAQEKQAS